MPVDLKEKKTFETEISLKRFQGVPKEYKSENEPP